MSRHPELPWFVAESPTKQMKSLREKEETAEYEKQLSKHSNRRSHEVQRMGNSKENCYWFKWKQSRSLGIIGSLDWLISLVCNSTYLFSLQLPRQILLVDELDRVKTGFLPIIFSAYLVDLSVDTTVLWQLKQCTIRTSWNRLRAFIKAIWKPHGGDVGEPVQIGKWRQTFAILCLKLK